MKKKLNEAVAKLHLEPGDALVVDGRIFSSSEDMKFSSKTARDCRIFVVYPQNGESVSKAFATLHAGELEALTKNKLYDMMRDFCGANDFPNSIIDGIEKDFCACAKVSEGALRPDGVICNIHERCAVLRTMVKA
jgi:hypothetical protein